MVVEHRAHPRVAGLRRREPLAAPDESRGEPCRPRAPCTRLRRSHGLHVLGAGWRRRDRLCLRLSVARRAARRSRPVLGEGVPIRPRCAVADGRHRLALERLAVRAAALRVGLLLRSTSASGDEHGREDRCCCERADEVETEAARPDFVDEHEERGREHERHDTASATNAARRKPWPTSPVARHRSSSDQYASSAAKSRLKAITGTETSSGASSMASSTAYVPPTSATASGTSGDQPRTIAATRARNATIAMRAPACSKAPSPRARGTAATARRQTTLPIAVTTRVLPAVRNA